MNLVLLPLDALQLWAPCSLDFLISQISKFHISTSFSSSSLNPNILAFKLYLPACTSQQKPILFWIYLLYMLLFLRIENWTIIKAGEEKQLFSQIGKNVMAWWHVAAKFIREIDSSAYLRVGLLLGMLWGPTEWPSEANLARGPPCPFWAVSLLTYHSPFWASVSLSDNEEQFSYLLVVFRTQAVQGKHLAQYLSRGENSLSGGYFCHHSLLQSVLLRTGRNWMPNHSCIFHEVPQGRLPGRNGAWEVAVPSRVGLVLAHIW